MSTIKKGDVFYIESLREGLKYKGIIQVTKINGEFLSCKFLYLIENVNGWISKSNENYYEYSVEFFKNSNKNYIIKKIHKKDHPEYFI